MKTKKTLFNLILMISIIAFYSCEEEMLDETDSGQTEGISEELDASTILELEDIRKNMMDIGIGVPFGAMYGGFEDGAFEEGRKIGSPKGNLYKLIKAENTDGRSMSDVCYTQSYTWNNDGSYTWTVDFGEGCESGDWFAKGKIIASGKSTYDSFEETIEFIEFGDLTWEISGVESNSGTYDHGEDSTDWEELTSTYSYESDFEVKMLEPEDSALTISWYSKGKEILSASSFTIETLTESVELSSEEFYTSYLESPLKMDFECGLESDVFVSGIQNGTYTYYDWTGEYSLDYGDGTCDNLALVTFNGETVEVDLGDEWSDDEWEDEADSDED